MMLHQRHLGDEVGGLDQCRLGVTPGDHDVQIGPPRGERRKHRCKVEIIVAERDIELIENDEAEAWVGHELLRFDPGALGCGDVAGEILRLPGEAFAHGVPGDLVAERGERVTLGAVPAAFDELHHADAMAAA